MGELGKDARAGCVYLCVCVLLPSPPPPPTPTPPPPPPTPRHASCARVLSIGTGRRHHTARQVNRPGPTGLHPAPHPHQQPPRRLWSPVVGELHPPTSLLQPSLPGRPGDLLLQLVSGWMGEWVHGALPACVNSVCPIASALCVAWQQFAFHRVTPGCKHSFVSSSSFHLSQCLSMLSACCRSDCGRGCFVG